MRIEILDHGYVELVESWGNDEAIIEAARMSTGKGFLGWNHYRQCRRCDVVDPVDAGGTPSRPGGCSAVLEAGIGVGKHDWRDVPRGDEGLLSYLWKNQHATPFEMGGLIVEVKAPIFVYREWHRHRTQSYNEMSARYTPLPDENYIPTVERLLINSKKNKQAGTAKDAAELTPALAEEFRRSLKKVYGEQEFTYRWALRNGVPKELARVHLPVGRYSRMRASANLRNWLAFLTLRMAPGAQWEIRQYANAVGTLVAAQFPRTWDLFSDPQN